MGLIIETPQGYPRYYITRDEKEKEVDVEIGITYFELINKRILMSQELEDIEHRLCEIEEHVFGCLE